MSVPLTPEQQRTINATARAMLDHLRTLPAYHMARRNRRLKSFLLVGASASTLLLHGAKLKKPNATA